MHFKAKGPERVTKKRVFQQRISNDSKWLTDLHLFSVLKEASNVSSTLSKPWLFPTGAIKNIRVLDTFRSRQMAKVEFIEDKECPLFSNQVIWSFNLFVPILHWLSTNNALFMRITEYHASCWSILLMPSVVSFDQNNPRNSGSAHFLFQQLLGNDWEKEACWSLRAVHMNGIASSDFFNEWYNNIFSVWTISILINTDRSRGSV